MNQRNKNFANSESLLNFTFPASCKIKTYEQVRFLAFSSLGKFKT